MNEFQLSVTAQTLQHAGRISASSAEYSRSDSDANTAEDLVAYLRDELRRTISGESPQQGQLF